MIAMLVMIATAITAITAAVAVQGTKARRRRLAADAHRKDATDQEEKGAHHEGESTDQEEKGAHHEGQDTSRRGSRRDTGETRDQDASGATSGANPSERSKAAELTPEVLAVGVDGGGTAARLTIPPEGWGPLALELLHTSTRTVREVVGVELRVEPITGGVHLARPGVVMLEICQDHARLVLPAAACILGDVGTWQRRWFPWASHVLGIREGDGFTGWESSSIDAHVDVFGVDMPDRWLVLEDAWSGRSARRRPAPDGYDAHGRLLGVWIGAKCDSRQGRRTDTALHVYNSTARMDEHPDRQGAAALRTARTRAIAERRELSLEQAAEVPVWRFEATLQGHALELQGDGGRWSLRDPRSWADPAAIAAALTYVFGTIERPQSGVIRLTDELDKREVKRRAPHPIWTLLREAIAAPPRGRLMQAREARVLEREAVEQRERAKVAKALGRLAGAVGVATSPTRAAHWASATVPTICSGASWADAVRDGRIAHAALHDHGEAAHGRESARGEDEA